MYESTLEWLLCPNCYDSNLSLDKSHFKGVEVMDGTLVCRSCNTKYPIKDGIPRFILRSASSNELKSQIRNANIQYYDSTAVSYEAGVDQREHQSEFNQNRVESIIQNLSNKTHGSTFLDVGCGTGNLLKYGRKYFARAIGADVSVEMLKKAREKGCEVVQAEALNLPFKCDTFNVVSIFSVLHHLYDYKPFFEEASRVLKPGGFLYADWDPVKPPKIDTKKISWRMFQIMKTIAKPLIKSAKRRFEQDVANISESEPEVKKISELAEYHNSTTNGCDRGIDFDEIKSSLDKNGFTDTQFSFHCAGRTLAQLTPIEKIKFFFFKFQNYPLERFAENIMVIAQRGNNESG